MDYSVIVILSLILILASPQLVFFTETSATTDSDGFPYLADGKVTIAEKYRGPKMETDGLPLNVTDYYYVYTTFKNPDNFTKSLQTVYYVQMIVDENGYAVDTGMNTYGDRTIAGQGTHDFQLMWVPLAPGEYTVKSFLISGLENPRILTDLAVSTVKVNQKIVALGEGEGDARLFVKSVSHADSTVAVVHNYCPENSYFHRDNVTLSIGEHFTVKAVDAYFLGMREEDGRAVFRYEANGEDDVCLI